MYAFATVARPAPDLVPRRPAGPAAGGAWGRMGRADAHGGGERAPGGAGHDFSALRIHSAPPAPAAKARAKIPGEVEKAVLPADRSIDESVPTSVPGPADNASPMAGCPAGAAYAPTAVTPSFVVSRPAAKRSNTDSSTTHTDDPTFTGHAAVDAAASVWRYQLDTVESKGKIQIVYYTADHYPAPTPTDDSGALTNVTQANWKAIVADLDANKAGMGGAWSAYRAEDVHEDYHWKVEWQGEVKKEMPKAEAEIAKLSVPCASAANATAAAAVLKPLASAEFTKAMKRARTAYDALGDSPGDPPYQAQVPVVEALINRIKAHATAQKWP
jgi:hypothetical protein